MLNLLGSDSDDDDDDDDDGDRRLMIPSGISGTSTIRRIRLLDSHTGRLCRVRGQQEVRCTTLQIAIPGLISGGLRRCLVRLLKPEVSLSGISSSSIPSSTISVEASEIVASSSTSSPVAGTAFTWAEPLTGFRIALRGHAIITLEHTVLLRPLPRSSGLDTIRILMKQLQDVDPHFSMTTVCL